MTIKMVLPMAGFIAIVLTRGAASADGSGTIRDWIHNPQAITLTLSAEHGTVHAGQQIRVMLTMKNNTNDIIRFDGPIAYPWLLVRLRVLGPHAEESVDNNGAYDSGGGEVWTGHPTYFYPGGSAAATLGDGGYGSHVPWASLENWHYHIVAPGTYHITASTHFYTGIDDVSNTVTVVVTK